MIKNLKNIHKDRTQSKYSRVTKKKLQQQVLMDREVETSCSKIIPLCEREHTYEITHK